MPSMVCVQPIPASLAAPLLEGAAGESPCVPAARLARRLFADHPEGVAWLDGDDGTGRGRSYLAAGPVVRVAVPFGEDALTAVGALREGFWVGYLAYDAAWSPGGLHGCADQSQHQRFGRQRTDSNAPVACFYRYDARLVLDHRNGEVWLEGESESAVTRLVERLQSKVGSAFMNASTKVASTISSTPKDAHREAIHHAMEAIAAGEIYQVNLARSWHLPLGDSVHGHSLALFEAMREASPVPLGFYLHAGDHQVLGRSMERFLSWTPDESGAGPLVTRPIKGTVARAGRDAEEAQALRTDPKEHAEHVMIVDLMRNDLGRVAQVGSVKVVAPLTVEPYAKLSHLVSTVRATTREGTTLGDVLKATFPPGSVTGAPKVRAVQLIEALEPEPRGIYCGAVGFIEDGALSLAVAIRTAVMRDGQVTYRAGGGLVEASDPDREVAETELKARVFTDALRRDRKSPS